MTFLSIRDKKPLIFYELVLYLNNMLLSVAKKTYFWSCCFLCVRGEAATYFVFILKDWMLLSFFIEVMYCILEEEKIPLNLHKCLFCKPYVFEALFSSV